MSAGRFETGKYSSDDGEIYSCRAQPETKALSAGTTTNAYAAGTVTSESKLSLRKGRRQFGLKARFVTVRLPETGGPDGYKPGSLLTVPLFTETIYDALTVGESCNYLGVSCEVVSKTPERP